MPELLSTGNVKPTTAAGGVRLDVDLNDAALIALIESLAQGHVALRVSNIGDVANAPGQVTIAGSNPSTGKYVLTCAAGWQWHAAVGAGNNLTSHRTITAEVDGSDARKLNVSVFNNAGTLTSVSFYIVGRVVPS